jgi:alpha-beta hydrolase superfamily lysophospholipase
MICSLFPGIKRFPIAKPTWDEEKGWKEEEFINNNLTSDKYRFERNYRLISKEPNLGVRGISIGWAYEAIKRTDQFKSVDWKNKIPKPTLLLSAKNDNLVDANINENLLSPIPNVSIVSINGKHELFMEEDHIREEAWRAVDVFLKNNFS